MHRAPPAQVPRYAEDDEEHVTFENVVEWYVLSPLSVKEIPGLEQAVAGFTGAFANWLLNATYTPPE